MTAQVLQAPNRQPRIRRRRGRPGDGVLAEGAPEIPAAFEDDSFVATSAPRARSRSLAVSLGAGISLTIVGVLVVLFVGYLFGYSNLQAGRDQRRLLSTYATSGELAAFRGHTPADGSPVAVLSVPSLGLHQMVVEGTSATDLEAGPGLMPASAVPGTRGVAVIAGRHGTYGSPFKTLRKLSPGAELHITDYVGTFTYRVVSVRALASGAALSVRPTAVAVLDLVTSRSSLPPSGLVVVSARLVGTPQPTATAARSFSASELALGGDSSAVLPLLGWAALLVLALALSVIAYRRLRRPMLVYLLSTPVLLVVLLFSFENLARLLPATM